MEKNASIAILFFSRSAELEASFKRWTGDSTRDRAIARSLRNHALSSIHKANLPYYEFSEKEQRGESFSQRLQSAFEDVFAKGHSHVIALGSDLPCISQFDWGAICERLLSSGTLLGPDARGGVYLIGMDYTSFKHARFQTLPWQSYKLFNSLISLFPETGLLEKRKDVNNNKDLQEMLKLDVHVVRTLCAILNIQWFFSWQVEEPDYSGFYTVHSKRGPPKVFAV